MKKINLNVNDIVVVSYEKSLYKCNIQDKLEENFCISIPVNKGEYLLVDIGEELSFGYCTDRGEFFEFDAKITGKNKADNVPMYILSKPYNLRKVQRRNYVRVPVVKDIEYKKHGEDKWKKAIALDLSGGGIKFKCNEEFKIN